MSLSRAGKVLGMNISKPVRPLDHAMSTRDIYGFEYNDIDRARVAVEQALGIRLQVRDSRYVGEYYQGAIPSGASLQLRRNTDPMHDEQSDPSNERFAEPEFQTFALLLYVSGLGADTILQILQQRVTELSLLRRGELA